MIHVNFCAYTAFMNLSPPRMRLPPEPPDQAVRDALEDQARYMRDEFAVARPARLAVLATGPPLRNIDRAVDCRCSCHPSPASRSLHEGGAECPCQLTAAERAERWNRLFENTGETTETSEKEDRERAELAATAAELDVDAEVRCLAFPFVVAGTCDGRSFFLREKRGHWRVEVAADPDCADLWGTTGSLGIQVAAGEAVDLRDGDGELSPGVALRLAVHAVRLSALRDICSHEQPSDESDRFCRQCGTPLDEVERWRWPEPPAA